MAYSQKYSLVHFIPPVKNGTQFHMSQWLLHITLADVFAINRRGTTIDAKLATLLAQIEPVKTTAGESIKLGSSEVVLMDKTSPLLKLHDDIVTLLEENGAIFNNPEYTKKGFLPHSTIQKSGRLHKENVATIDSLSLVDMFPNGDWEQRRVLATYRMKS